MNQDWQDMAGLVFSAVPTYFEDVRVAPEEYLGLRVTIRWGEQFCAYICTWDVVHNPNYLQYAVRSMVRALR